MRTSILSRIIWQALILTAFIILLLTTLSFIVSRTLLERSASAQLAAIATIGEDQLEKTLSWHRERAALLTANTDITAILAEGVGNQTLMRLFTLLQRDQVALMGMEVYDTKGALLARTGAEIGLPESARTIPFHRPVVTKNGWEFYDVSTPVWASGGKVSGYIALRYKAQMMFTPLLNVMPSLGDSAQVLFILDDGKEIQLMHPSSVEENSYVISIAHAQELEQSPIARVLEGNEGVMRAEDYKGQDSIVAYRYLPTLGWGLIIQVNRDSVLEDVRRLAISYAAIGTLLLILAAILASILARQVTEPLIRLAGYVRELHPGNWKIQRSVHTGDEVEVLDQVVVDMAARLKTVYEKQEEIIDERTRELRQQYERDRVILESIEYGVLTVDRTGAITGANPAATSLLAQKSVTMIGQPIWDIVHICAHQGKSLTGVHPVKECLKTGKPQRSPVNAHFSIRVNGDALLPVMYAVNPLTAGGKIFGAILVFQDITEERRLDYLKSEFISLASHQLRTPLSSLRWYVELFADDKQHLSQDQRGYLKEMQHSVDRMVALLTSLLRAAHLEGNNLEPDIRKVDLAEMMHEIEQDCRAMVQEAGLASSLECPRGPIMMETDPTLLRIVIQNLLSNAVKYTKQQSRKKIILSLANSAKDVLISVKDEGMGIPSAEQKRVFQKFFRARNVRKSDTDGNGLGLYISRSIVERLGGTITFMSAENKGTEFTVRLKKGGKKK